MKDIRTFLAEGNPLLFDGAMGTCFAALPGRMEERCEIANLTDPASVAAIHRAYLEAGCRAVKTNTFTVGLDLASGNETAPIPLRHRARKKPPHTAFKIPLSPISETAPIYISPYKASIITAKAPTWESFKISSFLSLD